MFNVFLIGTFFLLFIIIASTILAVFQSYYALMNQKEYTKITEDEIQFLKLYNKNSFKKYHYYTENIKSLHNYNIKLCLLGNVKKIDKANFVIFHHGIKSNHDIGWKYSLIYLARKEPFVFVSYDARGWGELAHDCKTSFGYYEKHDLHTIIEYIKTKYQPKNVYLHGESMGAATLLQYLDHYKDQDNISGIIADSPFLDFKNVLKFQSKKNFPYIPFYYVFFFLQFFFYFKNRFWIHEITISDQFRNIYTPVLIIFSECDCMIPFTEYELLKQTSLNFESFITKDSPHVLTIACHKKEYHNQINNFIDNTEKIKNYNKKNIVNVKAQLSKK